MTVLIQSGYMMPVDDYPLNNSRIAHSNNWLDGGTASASSTDSDFLANGPLNVLAYEAWKPSGTSSETWEYDHGSNGTCDYCVIGAHTIGTSGASLAVQYYNGASWVDLIADTAITDDTAIWCVFQPTTAQRWRIVVDGAAPRVAVVRFGLALQMPQAIYGGHTPSIFARQVVLRTNQTATGVPVGRTVQRRSTENTFEWQHMRAWWVEANWLSFQKAVEDEPFFIAWRPGSKQDVVFGDTNAVPQVSNMGIADLMAGSVSVVGYLSD